MAASSNVRAALALVIGATIAAHVGNAQAARPLRDTSSGAPPAAPEARRAPRRIIDVHLHGYAHNPQWAAHAPNPATGIPLTATDESAHRAQVLAQMHQYGVEVAVLSTDEPEILSRWQTAAGLGHIIPAISFNAPGERSAAWIRAEHAAGRLSVIGEIGAPYAGYSAGDSAYEAYFALAEELDIPIAVHVGTAAGQAAYHGYPKYRMELNRPLRLEDMLVRHPRARVQLMHAGWPFADETVALMKAHPQVYADLGVIAWVQPRAEFYGYLRRLMDAGLGKRIMFGSDEMSWPEAIGAAVEALEAAPMLTESQQSDLFYNNAARFLRLPGGNLRP